MDKEQLIEKLRRRGFSSLILNAFKKVEREKFVPENLKSLAYEDEALPLKAGATISQPYTIAFMLDLLELKKNIRILEIGSGSGYVLALLSEITSGEIFGIEIISSLCEKAKNILARNKDIEVFCRDGSLGLKEKAPFDRILISAASDKIPEHLYSQLKREGIIVVPVKNSIFQIKKKDDKIEKKEFPGFAFVPLVKD